jgi:hypothetical protein
MDDPTPSPIENINSPGTTIPSILRLFSPWSALTLLGVNAFPFLDSD